MIAPVALHSGLSGSRLITRNGRVPHRYPATQNGQEHEKLTTCATVEHLCLERTNSRDEKQDEKNKPPRSKCRLELNAGRPIGDIRREQSRREARQYSAVPRRSAAERLLHLRPVATERRRRASKDDSRRTTPDRARAYLVADTDVPVPRKSAHPGYPPVALMTPEPMNTIARRESYSPRS